MVGLLICLYWSLMTGQEEEHVGRFFGPGREVCIHCTKILPAKIPPAEREHVPSNAGPSTGA